MRSKQQTVSPPPVAKLRRSLVKACGQGKERKTAAESKETWYDMGKVLDWVESAANVDIRSSGALSSEQLKLRNEKLFPFIKDNFKYGVWHEKTDTEQHILIPSASLEKFLKYLGALIPDTPSLQVLFETYKKKSSLESAKGPQQEEAEIVIRSETGREHKYETRKKDQRKTSLSEDYVDDYDKSQHKQQTKHFAENVRPPRWVLIAWDIYTLLYNHNKGLMFHKPVDTEALCCPDYYTIIKNPIDLETVRHKLTLMLYPDLKGFVQDIRTMFANCHEYNGPEHKLAQHCEAIEKRLDKYLAKLKAEGKIDWL